MIKSFEELGDILAEFENRLSYLENSANNTQVGDIEERLLKFEATERQPTGKQIIDDNHKTRVLVNDLMNRMNKHMDVKESYIIE